MQNLHFTNWHAATWLVAILWAGGSIWINLPQSPGDANTYHQMATQFENATRQSASGRFFQVKQVSGLPFAYHRHELLPDGTHRLELSSNARIALNVFICSFATVSAIFVVQSAAKFSIRSLLVIIALCAILMLLRPWIGSAAYALDSRGMQRLAWIPGYIAMYDHTILFFLPCVVGMLIGLRRVFLLAENTAEPHDAPESSS